MPTPVATRPLTSTGQGPRPARSHSQRAASTSTTTARVGCAARSSTPATSPMPIDSRWQTKAAIAAVRPKNSAHTVHATASIDQPTARPMASVDTAAKTSCTFTSVSLRSLFHSSGVLMPHTRMHGAISVSAAAKPAASVQAWP